MRVQMGEKRKFLYEYSFYQVIREFNEVISRERGLEPITTSEGRALHERFLGAIGDLAASSGRDIRMEGPTRDDALLPTDFRVLANSVLSERMGYEPYADGGTLRRHSERFAADTGMDGGVRDVEGDGYWIPISPFDERFSHRSFAWSNGSALSWVRTSDFDRLDRVGLGWERLAELSEQPGGMAFTSDNLNMEVEVFRRRETSDGPVYDARPDRLMSTADLSGASLLRPYINSVSDYRDVARSMGAPFNAYRFGNTYTSERTGREVPFASAVREAQRNAAAAAAVLSDMASTGRGYEVVPDRYSGQAKVRDEVSGMEMRIADAPGNEMFVGRIWDTRAGVAYLPRLSSRVNREGSTQYAQMPRSAYTPELAVRSFAWACGRPDPYGGQVGRADETLADRRGVMTHGSFYAGGSGVNVAIGRIDNWSPLPNAVPRPVFVQMHADYSGYNVGHRSFIGTEGRRRAEEYISDAIAGRYGEMEDGGFGKVTLGAVDVFRSMVDLPGLVEEAREYGAVEGYRPDFELGGSVPDEVADVRADLWEYLTDTNRTLLDPDVDPSTLETVEDFMMHSMSSGGDTLDGRAENADLWLSMYADYHIGTREPGDDGAWFDLNGVARYAAEGMEGEVRQNLIAALRAMELGPEALKGESRSTEAADALRRFGEDMEEPTPLSEMPDGVQRRAMETVRDTLLRNMCEVDDNSILIDNHGIIQYVASRTNGEQSADGTFPSREIVGEVGPVFEKTELGSYVTDFAGSEDYELVPALQGFMVPTEDAPGEDVWQRMRAVGFEDRLHDAIASQVAGDVRRAHDDWEYTGRPDSLRRMWNAGDSGTKFSLDRFEDFTHLKTDWDFQVRLDNARVATEARRISFGSEVSREAGPIEHYDRVERGDVGEMFNDNGGDMYRHAGSMDWGAFPEKADSVFSVDRSGPAGKVHIKYVEGELHRDAAPTEKPEGYVLPIYEDGVGVFDHRGFNSAFRRQMAGQHVKDGIGVTDGEWTAFVTTGGYTDEDSRPISKEFAEDYQIKGENGEYRPLTVGDKIPDFNGNKATVPRVIDRDMSPERAEELGLSDMVELFRLNPDLAVVSDVSSTLSRANAGVFREALASDEKKDLYLPDGTVVPDGLVKMRYIISDKTADGMTNEDANASYGSQERILDMAMGAREQMRDGSGMGLIPAAGREKLSELLYCSYGVGVDGNRFTDSPDVDRNRISAPDERNLLDTAVTRRKDGSYRKVDGIKKRMRDSFLTEIAHYGGDFEIPFKLEFPSLSEIYDELPDGVSVDSPGVEAVTKGNETVYECSVGGGELPQAGTGTWLLPVLSKSLRENIRREDDGRIIQNRLTGSYGRLYDAVLDWKVADARLSGLGEEAASSEKDALERDKAAAEARAQREFDGISAKLTEFHLEGKYNIARSDIYNGTLRRSAVGIATGDPRLGIAKVGLSPLIARNLGVSDGDEVVLRRHPVLLPGHKVCVGVTVDDTITGVSIDPSLMHMVNGDFDGDTVVVSVPGTAAAREEAHALYHPCEMLCDMVSDPEKNGGMFPVNLGFGGDVAMGMSQNAQSAERFASLERAANDYMRERASMSDEQVEVRRSELVSEVDGFLQDMRAGTCGLSAISFTDAASVTRFISDEVVGRGVKGSFAKMQEEWMPSMGVTAKITPEGVDMATFEDVGRPLTTRSDDASVMLATTLKQLYPGRPGRQMQMIGAAMAPETDGNGGEMLSALRVNYVPYQTSVGDWKHSGPTAVRQRPYVDLFGEMYDGKTVDLETARVVYDTDGSAVPCDKETFERQLLECVGDKLDHECNPADVSRMADALERASGRTGEIKGIGAMAAEADFATRLFITGKPSEVITAVLRGEEVLSGPYFGDFADAVSRADTMVAERLAAELGDAQGPLPQAKALNAPSDVRDGYEVPHGRSRAAANVRNAEGEYVASMDEVFGRKSPDGPKPTAESIERAAQRAQERAEMDAADEKGGLR